MLIFRLFEDTRHIGPMAERQTIADAVKCVVCHFHSMPLTEASSPLQADHARKAMFCRHPQKCIAEKRNAAKFTSMAGAV